MKGKKIFALMLALLMVLSVLVSCGGEKNDDPKATTAATTVSTEGSGTTEKTWQPLEKLDLADRDFRVLGRDGGSTFQFTLFEVEAESLNGEVVNDAVYARNQKLKQDYNFNVKQTIRSDYIGTANLMYTSGEDLYDLVIYEVRDIQPHATSGYYKDLNTVDYINFDAPCWNTYVNEQLTIVGKLYYTTSDFLLVDKNRLYISVYNRELARDYEFGYIEDLVKNNEWTIDKNLELSRTVAIEVDGLPGHTKDDAFGIVMDSQNAFSAYAYGAGVRLTTIKDSVPVFTGLENDAATKVVKVLELIGDDNIAGEAGELGSSGSSNQIFCDGRALITTCFLSAFDTTLSKLMDFEYGFLPMPKYDAEAQDRYLTIPDPFGSTLMTIPYTCQDTAMAGYCLEAISEASTDTSLNAFYEVKCKLHNSYDQYCADMLDLVFENVAYDVVQMTNMHGMNDTFKSLMNYGGSAWARLYNKSLEAAQEYLDNVIESYKSHE